MSLPSHGQVSADRASGIAAKRRGFEKRAGALAKTRKHRGMHDQVPDQTSDADVVLGALAASPAALPAFAAAGGGDPSYDRHDYARALEQLKALGHDDYANVADLIGYAYRKLGDYTLSQVCYERALKSDPNHVLTWDYYWQIEQGNREQAEYHQSRIAEICGTDCSEYRTLAAALDQPPGTGLVY